jgi:surfactin synthase thioesterase subunit
VLVPWSSASSKCTALVCIPWAGAGAAPFRSWAPALEYAAAVYGVRLPGRESRQREPLVTVLGEAVAMLTQEVIALNAPRVALFGMCSGALLAFETAKALQMSGRGDKLAHLLVASQVPPRALAKAPIEPGDDIARYIPESLRAKAEVLEVLLPILRADIMLVSNYSYSPSTPLSVPLTVLYGACDGLFGRAEADDWRSETTATTSFHEIADADHLFGGTAWLDLANSVRAILT